MIKSYQFKLDFFFALFIALHKILMQNIKKLVFCLYFARKTLKKINLLRFFSVSFEELKRM